VRALLAKKKTADRVTPPRSVSVGESLFVFRSRHHGKFSKAEISRREKIKEYMGWENFPSFGSDRVKKRRRRNKFFASEGIYHPAALSLRKTFGIQLFRFHLISLFISSACSEFFSARAKERCISLHLSRRRWWENFLRNAERVAHSRWLRGEGNKYWVMFRLQVAQMISLLNVALLDGQGELWYTPLQSLKGSEFNFSA
jgi:hypothetical protein